jgi:DNA-directed RNA polymerase subunit RPC12/RpoP
MKVVGRTSYYCPRCHSTNDVDVEYHPEQVAKYHEIMQNKPHPKDNWWSILFWNDDSWQNNSITNWMWECQAAQWSHRMICPICGHKEMFWKDK